MGNLKIIGSKVSYWRVTRSLRIFPSRSNKSDYAMCSHVNCLIELGKTTEAKRKLDTFSEDNDDFVGEIEVAELYVEFL
jgi:hypothetical protein